MNKDEILELAQGLQHSNIKEIAQLGAEYVTLYASYEALLHKYTMLCAENVMNKHEKVFKRLAEHDTGES